MSLHGVESSTSHGPHNAEYELRKAYHCVIELKALLSSYKHPIAKININPVSSPYILAYQRYQEGNPLAAERWARASKHLARAFWHEVMADYLKPRSTDLPYLVGARKGEFNVDNHSDTTVDLLDAVISHVPPGLSEMPADMKFYFLRGKTLLKNLSLPEYQHELLQAEIHQAAYEYARVLECMMLAYEAENSDQPAA